jgi:hypothetical protein
VNAGRTPARWASVAAGLVLAMVVSGCGGGGGAPGAAPAAASGVLPDGSDPGPVNPPAAEFNVRPAQAQTTPSVWAAASTFVSGFDGRSSTIVRALAVYDTRTQTLAWRVPLSSFGGPTDPITPQGPSLTDWLVVGSDRYSDGRASRTAMGGGSLYYLDAQRVYRLDLTQDSLGAPELVSNKPVCWLRANPIPLKDDGSRAILSVYRPLNGEDCSGGGVHTMSSAMLDTGLGPTSDVAFTSMLQEPLLVMVDADGGARGIVSVNPSSRGLSLVVHSMNLRTELATLKTDVPSTGLSRVTVLPGHLGDVRRRLLRVGNQIRLLDWRSGLPTLSDSLLVLGGPENAALAVDGDASALYVGESCLVRRVDAEGQVATVATLLPEDGYVSAVHDLGSRLLVETDGGARTDTALCPGPRIVTHTGSKLFAIDKSSGARLDLEPGQVLGVVAQDLVVLRAPGAVGEQLIQVHSLSKDTRVTLAERLTQVALVLSPTVVRAQPRVQALALLDFTGKLRVLSLDGKVSWAGPSQLYPVDQGDGGSGFLLGEPSVPLPGVMQWGVPALMLTGYTMTVPNGGTPGSRSGFNVWQVNGTGLDLGARRLPLSVALP